MRGTLGAENHTAESAENIVEGHVFSGEARYHKTQFLASLNAWRTSRLHMIHGQHRNHP